MTDEIDLLLQRLETENSAKQSELASREQARQRAERETRERREALKQRRDVLAAELDATTRWVDAMQTDSRMLPTPRRLRAEVLRMTIRSLLCVPVAVGGALLHRAGLPDLAVGAAVVVPALAVWLLGDRCDALEARHG